MSMPTAVFLDTSILAGQQYNFASTALKTFIPAAKNAGVKLLLPDSMEREVKRQIRERSQEALNALDLARRRAPFLAKWESFPKTARPSLDNWQVTRVAMSEWATFLEQFSVTRLGYENLDIKAVMDWYDRIDAPFGEGKKRKEFPDAFSISVINSYAEKNSCFIAVASEDQDFKAACERFPNLLYFKSLPRLTELLLSTENNVSKFDSAIESKLDLLEEAIGSLMEEAHFYHSDRRFEINETTTSTPSVYETNIVAIGDNECTITFEAEFESEHRLEWEEYNGPDERPDRAREWVSETTTLSGTAKLAFNPKTTELVGVTYITVDEDEFEVSRAPRAYR